MTTGNVMRRLERKTKKPNLTYGQLENRSMLAGFVYVDVSGQDLFVIGDQQDNAFAIDLTAQTAETLVQGQGETSIFFSDDFDDGFDFSQLRDVRVYANNGDDSVTIYAEGFVARDRLIVSLAHGNDSLYIQGGEFGGDVNIYAGAHHDSIFLSNVMVGDDLSICAMAGRDIIALNGVEVADQTELLGQYGHDTILVNNSNTDGDFLVEMTAGADQFESVGSKYGDRTTIYGRQGWDSVMLNDSNEFYSTPILDTVERQAPAPNEFGKAGDAIEQLKADFFKFGNELPTSNGNAVQNALSDLASAFDIALISLELDAGPQTVTVTDPTQTVSVVWDTVVQAAVEATSVGPTIASRAYAMLHTSMYDAWSAFDDVAISTTLADDLQGPESENTQANKIEAMSFAAYRVLDDLFASQTDLFEGVMDDFGFDSSNTSSDATTPAGIGNQMAAALLAVRHLDGSNQLGDSADGTIGVSYSDTTDYLPVNATSDPAFIDAWTPEFVPVDTQDRAQSFLTPHWGTVDTFSQAPSDKYLPVAPQPFLLVDGTVDLDAKTITLADESVLAIDKSLIGTVINPEFIAQAEEVVEISANLTDKEKLIAEFWEDGGGTSFPPGTFMTFGQFVSARDNHSTDQDAKMFFALGNAVFDAGVATWEAKVEFDYTRPVRAIRELGELGLVGDFDSELGGYAIDAWTPDGGTQTILATDFLTYQTPGGDISPPFAEYTSGHSAFSAAGATILEMFTGSDAFGASVTFEEGESRFEPGLTPASPLTLSWDTFSVAADEAGESRLHGGIHFVEGDINGRTLGRNVGNAVWNRAQFFIDGGV
jgi:hypothetical protein